MYRNYEKNSNKMGMTMAKIDAQTSCLWINYQPKEPNAVINLRQKRLRKDN